MNNYLAACSHVYEINDRTGCPPAMQAHEWDGEGFYVIDDDHNINGPYEEDAAMELAAELITSGDIRNEELV